MVLTQQQSHPLFNNLMPRGAKSKQPILYKQLQYYDNVITLFYFTYM